MMLLTHPKKLATEHGESIDMHNNTSTIGGKYAPSIVTFSEMIIVELGE